MNYALVTGGSRGIGKAICLELATMGYNLIINYRSNDDEANNTLKEVKEIGVEAELLKFDISNATEVAKNLENFIDNNPDKQIEILVNNAGITKDNLMMFMTNEDFDKVIDVNLKSLFYVTKPIIIHMAKNKLGRIINIASESGLHGLPGQVNYSASKAGIIGATKSLALEWGKKNITVNAVSAGFINTDMTHNLPVGDLIKMIPLKRFGEPAEVASLVGFLASPKSSYITGQVISINGGIYT